MRFSQDFIEKIQESNNLVDLISQYTHLKPTGSGLMGRCPFPDHQEKTPSFSVSETKQVYFCFGCHKRGNIFTFLKDFHGMPFPEAIEYLAQRANIPLPQVMDKANETEDLEATKKKKILELNRETLKFFRNRLQSLGPDSAPHQYLKARGLTTETAEIFSLGFADSSWDGLTSYFQKKNLNLEMAEEAKLIKSRKDGKTGYFDIFRDRLIFPIMSPSGHALAFGGRVIGEGEPKYLNSPETSVFHKGKVLYGLDQTARYIRSEDVAIIVEGYMDLVSLFQAGIRNCVATMGTALTADHAKILKRITRNVVVLFDGDSAGVEAAERSLPILLAADLYPKGLILPGGQDPDDFIRSEGIEELSHLLKEAPDLFSRVLDLWMEGFRGEPSEKIKLVDKIRPLLNFISDSRLRELYFEQIAKKLDVHFHWLNQALNYQRPKDSVLLRASGRQNLSERSSTPNTEDVARSATNVGEEKELITLKGTSKAELNLLKLALKSRANFDLVLQEKVIDSIVSSGVLFILKKAEEVYGQDPSRFDRLMSLLISYVDQPDILFWNDENSQSEYDADKEIKLVKDCIKRVREFYLRDRAKSLALDLKLALKESRQMDAGTLEKIMDLQRNRISLNKIEKE